MKLFREYLIEFSYSMKKILIGWNLSPDLVIVVFYPLVSISADFVGIVV